MIISASYKTDIPAFYGDWFRARLKAGYCMMTNPYNRKQSIRVSLSMSDVDGFVFWTKNVSPFMGVLDEVHEIGFPFIVQHTITGYPRALEARVVDPSQATKMFRAISERFGAKRAVWRYDPIILSSVTDGEFHRENFTKLADSLAGSTDEVVVSFMQVYQKTRRNMNDSAAHNRFSWEDPPAEFKRELLGDLVDIAATHEMSLSICTQPDLMVPGAREARCNDAERLMAVAGRPFRSQIKAVRPGCGCFDARDIGEYDTCPHGCVYCYAVRRREVALERYRNHNPQSEYLFSLDVQTARDEPIRANVQTELPLFPPNQGSQAP